VLRCELEPGDVLFMPHDWYVLCQNPQHFPHPFSLYPYGCSPSTGASYVCCSLYDSYYE
jgi:hypothetical protein